MAASADGINNNGVIVGTYLVDNMGTTSEHGFSYSDGTYTTFDFPGAIDTSLLDLNRRGKLVGFATFSDANGLVAFQYKP